MPAASKFKKQNIFYYFVFLVFFAWPIKGIASLCGFSFVVILILSGSISYILFKVLKNIRGEFSEISLLEFLSIFSISILFSLISAYLFKPWVSFFILGSLFPMAEAMGPGDVDPGKTNTNNPAVPSNPAGQGSSSPIGPINSDGTPDPDLNILSERNKFQKGIEDNRKNLQELKSQLERNKWHKKIKQDEDEIASLSKAVNELSMDVSKNTQKQNEFLHCFSENIRNTKEDIAKNIHKSTYVEKHVNYDSNFRILKHSIKSVEETIAKKERYLAEFYAKNKDTLQASIFGFITYKLSIFKHLTLKSILKHFTFPKIMTGIIIIGIGLSFRWYFGENLSDYIKEITNITDDIKIWALVVSLSASILLPFRLILLGFFEALSGNNDYLTHNGQSKNLSSKAPTSNYLAMYNPNSATSGSGPSNAGTSGSAPYNVGGQASSSTGVQQGSSSNPSNSKRPGEEMPDIELPPLKIGRAPKEKIDMPKGDDPTVIPLSKQEAIQVIEASYNYHLYSNPNKNPNHVKMKDIGIGGQNYWTFYVNSKPIDDPMQKFLINLKIHEPNTFYDRHMDDSINTTKSEGQVIVKKLLERLKK